MLTHRLIFWPVYGCRWLQCTLTWSCFPFDRDGSPCTLTGSAVPLLSGWSLHCRNLGLEAEECPVRPVTEELEVLKKLIGGLQDVKLIGKVRGEGGGRWTQPWCFNSQHLWRRRRANRCIRKPICSSSTCWESNGKIQLLTWRCSRVIRDFISLTISTSLGTAGWWCFFDTLLSHSKWCS